jgi:hypothetical protein
MPCGAAIDDQRAARNHSSRDVTAGQHRAEVDRPSSFLVDIVRALRGQRADCFLQSVGELCTDRPTTRGPVEVEDGEKSRVSSG